MKRNMIVLGVITLLLGMSMMPVIGGHVVQTQQIASQNHMCENADLVDIKVREYMGDGTYVETTKKIPQKIVEKLKQTKGLNEKLSVLKKYSLVSNDASTEKYQNKLYQIVEATNFRAEIDDLLKKNYETFDQDDFTTIFNVLCKVEAGCVGGITIPVGSSILSGIPNNLLIEILFDRMPFLRVPSIDLMTLGCGIMGALGAEGLLGKEGAWGIIFGMCLIGFVGVAYWLPLSGNTWFFLGYSLLAAGFVGPELPEFPLTQFS